MEPVINERTTVFFVFVHATGKANSVRLELITLIVHYVHWHEQKTFVFVQMAILNLIVMLKIQNVTEPAVNRMKSVFHVRVLLSMDTCVSATYLIATPTDR